jgi:hypothetical protein
VNSNLDLNCKKKLLEAWDALSAIRIPAVGHRTSGFACGYCGGLEASAEPHLPDCPVYLAQYALLGIIPPFDEREKWLEARAAIQQGQGDK